MESGALSTPLSPAMSASPVPPTTSRVRAAMAAPSLTMVGWVLRIASLIVILALWECSARAAWVNPLFTSSPSAVARTFVKMVGNGSLWPHLRATSSVLLAGFAISAIVGVPMGLLLGRHPTLRFTLEPYIAALYASPTVAFLPLLIIWLGVGFASKTALVFLGSVVIMIVNTEAGVAEVDRRLVETARSFTASERQILLGIVLPSALPYIMAGLRLGIGRALVMVVVSEVYASNAGLGYLIFQAGGFYDTAQVFVGITVLAVAGVALNALLRAVEHRLVHWRVEEK